MVSYSRLASRSAIYGSNFTCPGSSPRVFVHRNPKGLPDDERLDIGSQGQRPQQLKPQHAYTGVSWPSSSHQEEVSQEYDPYSQHGDLEETYVELCGPRARLRLGGGQLGGASSARTTRVRGCR